MAPHGTDTQRHPAAHPAAMIAALAGMVLGLLAGSVAGSWTAASAALGQGFRAGQEWELHHAWCERRRASGGELAAELRVLRQRARQARQQQRNGS